MQYSDDHFGQVKSAAGRTLSPIITSLVLRSDVLFDI